MSLGWVAQLDGALSLYQKGCVFQPWSGCIWEAADSCFSLTLLFLSLPLSLESMTISLGEDEKQNKTTLHDEKSQRTKTENSQEE